MMTEKVRAKAWSKAILLPFIHTYSKIGLDDVSPDPEMLRKIFSHEDEIDPVSLMVWRRLIHWIGDLANYSEKVGNRLRLLVAH